MPLEPPPTKITQAFIDDICSSRLVDGYLYKHGIRCLIGVNFRDQTWRVSENGTMRLAKPTFTMLCNSRPGPDGGFIENAGTEERFLVQVGLDTDCRWNMFVTPVDREAFFDK